MWFLLPSCSSAMAIRKNTTRLAQILMLNYGSNHQFQCLLGRGGGVSHTTNRFIGPIWMSYHSTQLWHYLPRESIRVSRWRLPPPSSDASNKSRLWPCFWRTGYRLVGSKGPFLGFYQFSEAAHRVQRNILLTGSLVYYKRFSLGSSQRKSCWGRGAAWGWGGWLAKGEGLWCPLQVPLSLRPHLLTAQKLSKPHPFGFWRRKWQPTPAFLPGKSHGRRNLVGYSPWCRKESDTTEQLHFLSSLWHRHGWFSHWPQPLSFTWRSGSGTKNSNLVITFCSWQPAPILAVSSTWQKTPLSPSSHKTFQGL